jgi:hypothetical protein
MFQSIRRLMAAIAVLLLFVPMALVACRDKPQWHERPDRPTQTGRQDDPAGGGVDQQ